MIGKMPLLRIKLAALPKKYSNIFFKPSFFVSRVDEALVLNLQVANFIYHEDLLLKNW